MEFQAIVTDLIGVAVLLLTSLITAFVPILAMRVRQKWGLEIDEQQRKQLVSAINNGIAYGAQVVKDKAIPKALAADAQVQAAKQYVQETAPAALKHFDLPPASVQLTKKIISQMPIDTKPSTEGPPI